MSGVRALLIERQHKTINNLIASKAFKIKIYDTDVNLTNR